MWLCVVTLVTSKYSVEWEAVPAVVALGIGTPLQEPHESRTYKTVLQTQSLWLNDERSAEPQGTLVIRGEIPLKILGGPFLDELM
jgi:hypothetical protein